MDTHIYSRSIQLDYTTELINVVVGARRVGKSYFIKKEIEKLKAHEYLYIDIESEQFAHLSAIELGQYIDENISEKQYLYIDEIQNIKNWEKLIRRIYETKKYYIVLTGSSSKMLADDISTTLRGRSISYRMYPFSYLEIASQDIYDLNEYYKIGGFVQLQNVKSRKSYLEQYKKQIAYKDVIERYNLKHLEVLLFLIEHICNSASSLISYRKLHKNLMLAGHQVSVDTVIEYMQLLIDACFISEVKLYTRSKAKQLVNRRKFYCVDHCFVLNGRGPKFETMVYNNLISKRLSVNYYLEEFEVDFIVSTENEVIPIQACISVVEDKTFDREIGGILRFYNSHFSIQNKTAYVITKNETSTEKIGDITVEIVKFEDFFMNIDKTFRLDITDDIEF